MKLNFENLEAKLGVIPLYPQAKWGQTTNSTKEDGLNFREIKLELRANPADAKSVKMGAYFKVFDSGTPEQWCRWRDDLVRAWNGLGNKTGETKALTARHLLEGQALDDFNGYLTQHGETSEEIDNALRKVAVNFFPADAVVTMKQYLNYEAKKHTQMDARRTATRLQLLNSWFPYFPADGGSRLDPVAKIADNELSMLYFRLLPNNWRRKMQENGSFCQYTSDLTTIVEYAERLEVNEGLFNKQKKRKQDGDEPSGGNSQSSANKKGPGGHRAKGGNPTGKSEADSAKGNGNSQRFTKQVDCLVHGVGCGHGSHQCKVLKAHSDKVKAQWEARPKQTYKKHQIYRWRGN
jgi:hypothetical protein